MKHQYWTWVWALVASIPSFAGRAGVLSAHEYCHNQILQANFIPPNPHHMARILAARGAEAIPLSHSGRALREPGDPELGMIAGKPVPPHVGKAQHVLSVLFRREILFDLQEQLENRVLRIVSLWKTSVSRQLEAERDADPEKFVQKYLPLVEAQVRASVKNFDTLTSAKKKANHTLNPARAHFHKQLDLALGCFLKLFKKNGEPFWSIFDTALADEPLSYYDSNNPFQYHFHTDRSTTYENFIAELNQIFDLSSSYPYPELKHLANPKTLRQIVEPIRFEDGTFELQLNRKHTRAIFNKRLAMIELMSIHGRTPHPKNPVLALAHGASTWKSTVASWNDLISLFEKYSFNTSALDLPGALGPMSLSLPISDISGTAGALLEWYHMLRQESSQQPVIGVGRSFGSTQHYMAALATHLFGVQLDRESADAYFLTSFSNPFTMDQQIERVRAISDPKELVEGTLEALPKACGLLAKVLESLPPGALDEFGDEFLIVVGEADADGGPEDLEALKAFLKQYAPRAHLYVIPDPWKGLTLSPDQNPDEREASHFLFSSRKNVDSKSKGRAFPGIPDSLLPQFSDQNIEMMALNYAFLDYRADFSDATPQSSRDRIVRARQELTGENQPHAYLRWFLKELRTMGLQVPSLEKIMEDLTPASSEVRSIPDRIKRIFVNFMGPARARIQSRLSP